MKALQDKLKSRQSAGAQGGAPKPPAPKPPAAKPPVPPVPSAAPPRSAPPAEHPPPRAGAPPRPATLPPPPGGPPAPAVGLPPAAKPPGAPPPGLEPPGVSEKQNRLSRIRPDDFVTEEGSSKGMTEWMLPEEKLPDGIEEIMVSMASSGEKPSFQWMVDPETGPPFEGTAKSAEEAFMAIRANLTEHAGGFGQEFGGLPKPGEEIPGLPGQPPISGQPPIPGQPQPGKPPIPGQRPPVSPKPPVPSPAGQPGKPPVPDPLKRPPVLKALEDRYRKVELLKALGLGTTANKEAVVAGDKMVDASLESIAKGLVAADVFIETATGADLRDILPTELLDELSRKLSAAIERRG